MRHFLSSITCMSALVLASGCNAVLGIDAAEVDPALSSTGVAGSSGAAGSTGTTPCDLYCNDSAANCTGDNAEYTSRSVCMKMCQVFEPGVDGETDKDSLACRAYHAKAAKDAPTLHCRHSGVLGGGVCGNEPCAAFCLQAFAFCAGASLAYISEAECLAACKGKMQYLSGEGDSDLKYTGGDSLNCRLYHLEAAVNPDSPTAKVTHCPHTKLESTTCFNEGAAGAAGAGGAAGAAGAAGGGAAGKAGGAGAGAGGVGAGMAAAGAAGADPY